ncbi:MAG TPA: DNA topoisomerase IV subunit A, partial [Alphaproteobacteria bacterium]|nr:DNA topoisomerase IV subunit A [Alphaproteobacteria bacterium]
PLVDGQGNFGNIDGDNAAAMRYTEARMSNVARLLLDGIDEDAVDFRATYDGESEEPVILPAAFPNLLANGAQGIAVGMATSIPPHNVLELADAILHLIRYPNAGHDTISGFVKGPDFPTGGVLVEDPATIAEAYQTGRGSFRVRADWTVEKEKGGAWKIIVTAIPYQVQKSRLVEKMAEMLNDKKLPVLADIRDESAEDLRLVLEPKSRRIDPVLMMESLFKLTDLESRVSLNLNVLDASGKPGVLSLKSALLEWIDHRLVVLQRRSRYRLGKIASRLEVLEGYLVVYLNLDEVIAIIREEDNPKTRLMERFGLNENQANAILDMRLRSLRKLEEMEIRGEREKLEEEKTGLTSLLADEDQQRRSVARDVKSLKTDFARIDQRRTRLDSVPEVEGDPMDMLVEKEPITVICSEKGWIRAAKGHLASDAEVKFKEGDGPAFMVHAETTDRILVAADNGRFYTLSADKLPGGRGFGEPVSLMVELGADTTIINLFPARGGEILIVADTGHGFITATDQVMAQTRNGKQVLTLPKGVKAAVARPAIGDMVAVVGSNRKLLVFPRDDLPVMGRGRGVMLQRYRDGTLGDARCFNRADGLSWVQSGGRNRTEPDTTPWQGKRGSAGRVAPTGFPRPARFT